MNVLSLFDGMSCGRIALDRAGLPVTNYYASEIDKYAIQVSKANWPDIEHVGDVTKLESWYFPKIDLLIGGSPCQGFSFAGKQLNFSDPRSELFFEFVRLLQQLRERNPKIKFLLENVVMKKEYQDVISEALGIKPILINSALVSAQNRKRLYWTNIPFLGQPDDRGILLKDIIEIEGFGAVKNKGELMLRLDKSQCLDANYHKGVDNHGQRTVLVNTYFSGGFKKFLTDQNIKEFTSCNGKIVFLPEAGQKSYLANDRRICKTRGLLDKSTCLTLSSNSIAGSGGVGVYILGKHRIISPRECERLQGVPDDYTQIVSKGQRYRMLGNGWNVDTIVHLFQGLKCDWF